MLFPRSPFYFSCLLVLSGLAFAPLYLMQLEQANLARHYHAVFGTLWLLVLIVQPLLIRLNNLRLHRSLGFAALLIGVGFTSSLWIGLHNALNLEVPFFIRFGEMVAFQQMQVSLVFMFLFFKAIEHRGNTGLHARYMMATGLLMIEPVVERLLGFWVPGFMTDLDDVPMVMSCAHATVLGVCGIMLWKELHGGRCFLPFLAVTALTVSKIIVLHVFQTGTLWTAISQQYAALPALQVLLVSTAASLVMVAAAWRFSMKQSNLETEVTT